MSYFIFIKLKFIYFSELNYYNKYFKLSTYKFIFTILYFNL